MQPLELLELNKMQEMTFGDSKDMTHLQQTIIQTQNF
jgi:hypothetical protein